MVRITYIEQDGQVHETEASEGISLMQNAVNHHVYGIEAECGGACACATCHIFVPEEWQHILPDMSDEENDMLDFTAVDRSELSRLSCQIPVNEAMEGMNVNLPETQT